MSEMHEFVLYLVAIPFGTLLLITVYMLIAERSFPWEVTKPDGDYIKSLAQELLNELEIEGNIRDLHAEVEDVDLRIDSVERDLQLQINDLEDRLD